MNNIKYQVRRKKKSVVIKRRIWRYKYSLLVLISIIILVLSNYYYLHIDITSLSFLRLLHSKLLLFFHDDELLFALKDNNYNNNNNYNNPIDTASLNIKTNKKVTTNNKIDNINIKVIIFFMISFYFKVPLILIHIFINSGFIWFIFH